MELRELLFGINEMQIVGKGIHTNCTCRCGEVCNAQQITTVTTYMCIANSSIFSGFTTLWTSIVCPKFEMSLWHARPCLLGECQNYGINTLRICLEEVRSQSLISWKSIGYEVVGHTKDGKEKALKLKYHETPPSNLINYLKPCLKEFVFHNYMARWWDTQF